MHFLNNGPHQGLVIAALNTWYGRATNQVMAHGAWYQLHNNGSLLYNCGGVNPGGDYGVDWVDHALYVWLTTHLPAGFAFTAGPNVRWGGLVGANGQPQFTHDYYNITRVVGQQAFPAGIPNVVPAGNRNVVLNFHLYVGGWQANNQYVAPLPPAPPAVPPPALNIADLRQFPPLG
jgi:hypothetical protein